MLFVSKIKQMMLQTFSSQLLYSEIDDETSGTFKLLFPAHGASFYPAKAQLSKRGPLSDTVQET